MLIPIPNATVATTTCRSSPGHTLLSVLDGQGGAWLLENWLTEAMP
ncbi:hypothetical protein JK228_25440 [Serratia rubidaea]|nr:hypothetical protein [Serratia rubidaea]